MLGKSIHSSGSRHFTFLAATRRRLTLSLGVLVTFATMTLATSNASALTCTQTQTLGSFSATNAPSACWRPYGTSSPFNKQIPADPRLAPDSGAALAHISSYGYQFFGGSHRFMFASQGSRPVYWSSPSDPVVTVHCTAYWGPGTCQGANGVSIDAVHIHIPAGAQPEAQWDAHMTIVDQANNAEYDFERASWTGPNQLTVWSGGELPISGPSANGLNGAADAADLGLLGGIIRPEELAQGLIDHALSISVPCTAGYVWPAQGAFGYACSSMSQSTSDALKMGDLLQLNLSDAQIAATHAPRWQQTIMRAMAHYGMYVNDTNGPSDPQTLELESQDDTSFTSLGKPGLMANTIQSFGGSEYGAGNWVVDGIHIDVSKLRVIDPCVQRGTCAGSIRMVQLARERNRHHKRARNSRAHSRIRKRTRTGAHS